MIRFSHGTHTLLILGLLATAGFVTLRAQTQKPESEEMKALVGEVRALRLAIERASAVTSQSQLLLGRVQLQENRLATLGRQYQEARTRALDARMAQTHLEQQLRQLSERVNSVSNHDERLGVEHRIGQLKSEIAQQAVKTGQLQTDEADAAHMLSTEQQRWSDFNQRLETVERTLEKSGAGR